MVGVQFINVDRWLFGKPTEEWFDALFYWKKKIWKIWITQWVVWHFGRFCNFLIPLMLDNMGRVNNSLAKHLNGPNCRCIASRTRSLSSPGIQIPRKLAMAMTHSSLGNAELRSPTTCVTTHKSHHKWVPKTAFQNSYFFFTLKYIHYLAFGGSAVRRLTSLQKYLHSR